MNDTYIQISMYTRWYLAMLTIVRARATLTAVINDGIDHISLLELEDKDDRIYSRQLRSRAHVE